MPTDAPSLYANRPMSTSGFAMSEYKCIMVSLNFSMSYIDDL